MTVCHQSLPADSVTLCFRNYNIKQSLCSRKQQLIRQALTIKRVKMASAYEKEIRAVTNVLVFLSLRSSLTLIMFNEIHHCAMLTAC